MADAPSDSHQYTITGHGKEEKRNCGARGKEGIGNCNCKERERKGKGIATAASEGMAKEICLQKHF